MHAAKGVLEDSRDPRKALQAYGAHERGPQPLSTPQSDGSGRYHGILLLMPRLLPSEQYV